VSEKPFILVCDGMDKGAFESLKSITEFPLNEMKKSNKIGNNSKNLNRYIV